LCLIHQSCASSTFLYQEQKKNQIQNRERERDVTGGGVDERAVVVVVKGETE